MTVSVNLSIPPEPQLVLAAVIYYCDSSQARGSGTMMFLGSWDRVSLCQSSLSVRSLYLNPQTFLANHQR